MSQEFENLYEILGVGKTAKSAEIKKAFFEKAKETHPDQNPGKEEEFKRVNFAYQVLSDEEKRARYDLGEYDVEEDLKGVDFTRAELDAIGLLHNSMKDLSIHELMDPSQSVMLCRIAVRNEIKEAERLLSECEGRIETFDMAIAELEKEKPSVPFKKKATQHHLLKYVFQQNITTKQLEIRNLEDEIQNAKKVYDILGDFIKEPKLLEAAMANAYRGSAARTNSPTIFKGIDLNKTHRKGRGIY
jgi:DnaJ-domain-containing protein 1